MSLLLPLSPPVPVPVARAASGLQALRRLATRLLSLPVALLVLGSPVPGVAGPLVTPAELAAQLADPSVAARLRLIDIRAGREANGRSPFDNGHVAGAQPAPYPQWRGPKDNPGRLPPLADLTELVQRLGLERDTPAVVVFAGSDSTDFGSAARVAWTLKALGVQQVAILNGGIAAWRAAQLPLVTEARPVAPSRFEPVLDPAYVATRAEVEAVVAQRGDAVRLLDARPASFFTGEDKHAAARLPGTIAGSRHLDNAIWFKPDSAELLDPEAARRLAAERGIDLEASTVSFCNTGHWAATNWFVLSEVLGARSVRLYPESVVEWSRTGGAMDNVPGRLRQFWLQIRQALAN